MANGTWRTGMDKKAVELVEDAAAALKLNAEKEIMAAAVKDGVVTIVTIGAHKVRWKLGDKVEPLHPLHAGRSIKPQEPPKEK
jgi:hypothetical protein